MALLVAQRIQQLHSVRVLHVMAAVRCGVRCGAHQPSSTTRNYVAAGPAVCSTGDGAARRPGGKLAVRSIHAVNTVDAGERLAEAWSAWVGPRGDLGACPADLRPSQTRGAGDHPGVALTRHVGQSGEVGG